MKGCDSGQFEAPMANLTETCVKQHWLGRNYYVIIVLAYQMDS